MKLSASGRVMEIGDTWKYPHNGTQDRRTETGVRLEIYNLTLWKKYKAAVKRKTSRELQDLPLAPSVQAKQERARLNLSGYSFTNTKGENNE